MGRKPNGYWTKERCFEEAKKYRYQTEFHKKAGGAFSVAYKNGWLKDYKWFEDGNKLFSDSKRIWNFESCMNLAKQCRTKSEFKSKNAAAYQVARKKGWLSDYTWFEDGFKLFAENKTIWNYEACLLESKKYKTRSEFCKKAVGAYTAALNHSWLDNFSWLRNEAFDLLPDQVDSVYAYIFEKEKTVYIGRTLKRCQKKRDRDHIINISDTVAKYAKEKNLPIPPMTVLEDNLSLEKGSKQEGEWLNYFKGQGYSILNKCKTGAIGAVGRGKWTQPICFQEAQKYTKLVDFYTNSKCAYRAANENGWLKDYYWLERGHKERVLWTDELCIKESKKYTSKTEFNSHCSGGYKYALTHRLLDSFTWLKPKACKSSDDNNSLQLLIWE